MTRWRSTLAALAAYSALAAILTFPQITHLSTAVADHPDPLFSVWRLAWVAHQLRADPAHLFEANIFYPEHGTFAYSDAMLLPAASVAPLFWMGVSPIAIYNLTLLGGLALSAFTMFLLCRMVTGDSIAAFAGGIVYGFAPYRFEQYVHVEMQMVFWIPVALLALHRLLAGRRLRDGAMFGAALAAQLLSGVYAAMYFAASLVVLGPALVIAAGMRKPGRVLAPLAVAMVVALALALPYAAQYSGASALVGSRSIAEIEHYGASAANYAASPPSNRLYGWTSSRFGGEELHLFPGLAALALAIVAVVRRPTRIALAYLALLLFALEASRGFEGITYPLLYRYIPPLRSLRVPARFDLIVNLALGVLAAIGLLKLREGAGRAAKLAGVAAIVVMTIEYAASPALASVARPSLGDRWLASQPRGVVLELPLPHIEALWPSRESRYMYEGTVHWLPMLNGYSGFFPASYLELLGVMDDFPARPTIDYLRQRGVNYILIRGSLYEAQERQALREALERAEGVRLLAGFPAPGEELIFTVTATRPQ
jgi:hypothetical protein